MSGIYLGLTVFPPSSRISQRKKLHVGTFLQSQTTISRLIEATLPINRPLKIDVQRTELARVTSLTSTLMGVYVWPARVYPRPECLHPLEI